MFFVLLKGSSQYGAQELHIQLLAAALAQAGHETVVLDTGAADFATRLLEAARRRPQMFLSINGVGSDLKFDEVSAYDRLDAGFASLYLDNPLYHLERLACPIRRKAALFLDRSHVELARAWAGGAALRSIGFLPPGALAGPGRDEPEQPDAFARRDIGLLFTGTFRGEPVRHWLDWPEGATRAIVADLVDRMLAGDLPILQALGQAFEAFGAELTPRRLDGFLPLLNAPQSFVEAYHRAAFIHALGRADAPVVLYGHGWDDLAARYPAFDYRGHGSFAETLTLLPRTRIVLNTNNAFVAGGHERVFTAMTAGAHVFSDASSFYADAFEEGREISTFRWRDLARVPARLEGLMADGDALAALAAAGQGRALREHSWASRVDGLIEALSGV